MGPDSSSGPTGPLLPASFGRYTLLERVGGGGMATVYRASLSGAGGFEKEVAVKVIRVELAEDPQFTQMFLDEARLSARLNHANIVQTFDFGQEQNVHFLAMELVRGRTLAALLKVCKGKGTRLGIGPSLRVAAELARALDYAHRLVDIDGKSLGIVHRDVSPQNVLVSREGEVKLADFGIAKAVMRSHVTQPGRVRGKCAYMAPEQIRGRELDGRADVFALGVILWESLCGRSLFDGSSDAAVLHQVLEKEILPPSWFAREIPAEVDALVMRLLSREVEDRPDSGQASRALADLIWRVVRSEADIDLAELQRRLSSGTAVYEPAAALAAPKVAEPAIAKSASGDRVGPQPTTLRDHLVPSSLQTFDERVVVETGDEEPSSPATWADSAEARGGENLPPDPGAETLVPERLPAAEDLGRSGATTAPVAAPDKGKGSGLRLAGILSLALAVGVAVGIFFNLHGSDWLAAVTSPSPLSSAESAPLDGAAVLEPEAIVPPVAALVATPPLEVEEGQAVTTIVQFADGDEERPGQLFDGEAGAGGEPEPRLLAAAIAAEKEATDPGPATSTLSQDVAPVHPVPVSQPAVKAGSALLAAIGSKGPGEAKGQEELPFMGVLLWGGSTPSSAKTAGEAEVARAGRQVRDDGRARSRSPARTAPIRKGDSAEVSQRSPGMVGRTPVAPSEVRGLPPGELAVSSMLEGATLVTIDGVTSQTLGRRAPARLTLSAGRHRVVFVHEESGMFCGVVAEIESGKMLALNADANGVGVLKGAVRTPIPCTVRR